MKPNFNEDWFLKYQTNLLEFSKRQSQLAIKHFNQDRLNSLIESSIFSPRKILAMQQLNDSVMQNLTNKYLRLRELTQSPDFHEKLQKMASGFKALEHFNQTLENSAPLLKGYHWLIPNSMRYSYIRKDVYEALKSDDVSQSKIDDVFLRYYTHNNF